MDDVAYFLLGVDTPTVATVTTVVRVCSSGNDSGFLKSASRHVERKLVTADAECDH